MILTAALLTWGAAVCIGCDDAREDRAKSAAAESMRASQATQATQATPAESAKQTIEARSADQNLYGTCEVGDGGSGKTYMGREIAEVMGHFGVSWLERPEREREDRTDLLVAALKLQPTYAVADIGAGSGYFTMRMSPLVPEGVVYATDIQPEMLDIIRERALEENALNVMPILGTIEHCGLEPASVDVVLFVDAYHEFSHPREMMRSIVTALKPNGRVALVEFRAEDPTVLIKARHKMTQAQAQLEMEAVGLTLVDHYDELPQQHVMFFGKRSN